MFDSDYTIEHLKKRIALGFKPLQDVLPPCCSSAIGVAIAIGSERLAKKCGKDYLNADDLMEIMGIGKNNARMLMNRKDLPTIKVSNRKVVSVIAFVYWSIKNNT